MKKTFIAIMLLASISGFAKEEFIQSEKRGTMIAKTFVVNPEKCIKNIEYKGTVAICSVEVDPSDDYDFQSIDDFQIGAKWTSLSTEVGNLEFRLLLHPNGYLMDFESLHRRELAKEFLEPYIRDKIVENLSEDDQTIKYFVEDK
jgi:hypothetical protein